MYDKLTIRNLKHITYYENLYQIQKNATVLPLFLLSCYLTLCYAFSINLLLFVV